MATKMSRQDPHPAESVINWPPGRIRWSGPKKDPQHWCLERWFFSEALEKYMQNIIWREFAVLMQVSRPRPQQNRTSCPNGWRGSVRSNSADRTTSQRIRISEAARPHLCFIFFILSWHFPCSSVEGRVQQEASLQSKIISLFMVLKQRQIFTSNTLISRAFLARLASSYLRKISFLFISTVKIFSKYCFVKIFFIMGYDWYGNV